MVSELTARSKTAERMRRYRKRRRSGSRWVPVVLVKSEVDQLVRMKLLLREERHDPDAVQAAVMGLIYRVLEREEKVFRLRFPETE